MATYTPYSESSPSAIRFNPWWVRLPLLLMLAAVLMLFAIFGLLAYYQTAIAGKIAPGVYAFGVNLGGLSREQAQQALDTQFTYDDNAVFTFRDGANFWQMTAGELGIAFDLNATIDAAYQVGRDANPIGNLVTQGLTWLNGEAVAPVIVYDQNLAAGKLAEIAVQINRPALDGGLMLNGTQVIITPGQTGRTLDIPATLLELDRIITTLNTGAEIPLIIHEALPSVVDLERAQAQAEAALSAPLTLTTDNPHGGMLGPWTISTEQLASLLQIALVAKGDGTKHYQVSLELDSFRPFLETLAPGLKTQPQDARFHFNEVTRQLDVIQSGVGGRSLNLDQTIANLEAKVFSITERQALIAYDYVQPRFHNSITAAELGITELVVEATTYYAGSPANRRQNIAVGAALYDGVILAPGEEFSFNRLLGDLSAEAGFTEGNVIFGGRTIQGIGGGICQVSTTAFRAAFKGGYQITERNAHGYRVGYYEQNGPPGFDAAIWTPERDFKFINDTPYHLLIETEVFPATSTLQFRFYSTNTGRQVQIDAPIIRNVLPAKETRYEANPDLKPGEILQVDYAAEGADVTILRTIRDATGQILRQDSVYTHYLPWGAIYQVAPDDPRLGT